MKKRDRESAQHTSLHARLRVVFLDRLRHAVRLAGVDGLASLLDLLQHGCVLDAWVGVHVGGLRVEGDGVGFHAFCCVRVRLGRVGGKGT